MTDMALSKIALPAPAYTSQATLVEQSRSVAEVLAAIHVAQQYPRNQAAALAAIMETCKHRPFAEKAFFSYSRGGSTVSGPSVHLARALALAWGNMDFGVKELERDDAAHRSEIQAFAWDQQRNVRSTNSFILPHKRDKRGGPEALTDLRDIYENNANNGARRLRECVFAVIPPEVVSAAIEQCRATLAAMTPEQVRDKGIRLVRDFGRGGITPEQLAEKVGAPQAQWDAEDVVELELLFNSLRSKEITRDEAFPPKPVTADELAGEAPAVPQVAVAEAVDPAVARLNEILIGLNELSGDALVAAARSLPEYAGDIQVEGAADGHQVIGFRLKDGTQVVGEPGEWAVSR